MHSDFGAHRIVKSTTLHTVRLYRKYMSRFVFDRQVNRRDSVRSSGSQRPATDSPDNAGQQQQQLQFSDWQSSSTPQLKQQSKCDPAETGAGGGRLTREPVRVRNDNGSSLLVVPTPKPNALVPPQLSRSYVTLAIPEEHAVETPLLRSRFPVRRPADDPTANVSAATGGPVVNALDVRIEACVRRKT